MKLSPLTIILLGFFVFLWCLTFGWIQWQPNMKEAAARDANREAAETEAGKAGQAKKRVAAAVQKVKDEAALWRSISAVKTPPASLAAGGIDISQNGAQLIVDSRTFRDSIQKAVNKQLRIGGVKLVGDGPYIADPGESSSTILAEFYNYPSIPFPVVIFDLGTITVSGTYEQIAANVRGWSRMPNYLAVADGLRLDGTSPHLTGTYAVSLVGYVRGSKLFVTLPETPGSSTASGGGGLAGGGFGGGRGPAAGPRGGGGMPPGVPGAGAPAGMAKSGVGG